MKTKLYNVTSEEYGVDLKRIDPRTVAERYSNPATALWVGHTQVWTWDGGDAIVVVTNRIGEPCSAAVVIRVGDTITTIPDSQRGLYGAMQAMGLDTSEFQVAAGLPS